MNEDRIILKNGKSDHKYASPQRKSYLSLEDLNRSDDALSPSVKSKVQFFEESLTNGIDLDEEASRDFTPKPHPSVSPSKLRPPTNFQSLLVSTNALHKRQVEEYQSKLQTISKQYEEARQKADEYRNESRKLRQVVESQQRELDHVKKTLEKVNQRRNESEEQLKQEKEHSKKLEVKLSHGKQLALLDKKVVQDNKIKNYKEEIQMLKANLASKEDEISRYTSEINVLTSALAVQGNSVHPDEDYKSVLLYDLAKSKEEGYVLAKELAKQTDKVKALEQKLAKYQQSNEELTYIRELNNQELLVCEKKIFDFQKRIEQLSKNLQDSQREKEMSLNHLRGEVEKRIYAEKKLEDFESTYQQNIEEIRVGFEQQLHSQKENNFNEEAFELAIKRETDKRTALEAQIEEMTKEKADLMEEIENLNSEVDHLTEANSTLQSSLAEKKQENEQLEETLANQRRDMSEREMMSEKSSALLVKQVEERLRSELNDLERDREVVKKLLEKQELENRQLLAKLHKIEQENQEAREANDSINRNKHTLENTLLDQLTNVRLEIDKLRDENKVLDKKNFSLENENARLQILLDTEHTKSLELMKQWEKMTNVLTSSLSPSPKLVSPKQAESPFLSPKRDMSLTSPKNLTREMTPSKIELTELREQEDDY